VKTILVGPVYPYRGGVSYCTVELAKQLPGVDVISFSRQFPKSLYPGKQDLDPTLPPFHARRLLDILNPLTWLRTALTIRRERPDALVLVWYIWVWALPYLTLLVFLPKRTRVILQCHNISHKEPAWWKNLLTNIVLRRGDALVVHAKTEAEDAATRVQPSRIVTSFLPVHGMGGRIPSREEARRVLGLTGHVALFFGHIRPFKALDVTLRAWRQVRREITLVVAGQAWWKSEAEYRELAQGLDNVRLDFRFIPDAEIATYFAAADVVLAPYRVEAQSGVALTSFHFGRPVIATNVGGLPEIIEEGVNGMLIPPESPEALAKAVEAFFARTDREAMDRHSAAAARKYSWEEYGAVYRRLVAGE
jgi:glycosyltransferase involved in cell wall biosynthesis